MKQKAKSNWNEQILEKMSRDNGYFFKTDKDEYMDIKMKKWTDLYVCLSVSVCDQLWCQLL